MMSPRQLRYWRSLCYTARCAHSCAAEARADYPYFDDGSEYAYWASIAAERYAEAREYREMWNEALRARELAQEAFHYGLEDWLAMQPYLRKLRAEIDAQDRKLSLRWAQVGHPDGMALMSVLLPDTRAALIRRLENAVYEDW